VGLVAPAAPSLRRRAPASGFTLIEVLVVLAIVAIAAAVATVAFDGGDRERAMREARRFAGALEHAAARAQVRAETLGVSADGSAWRFWRRDDSGGWQPIGDDDVLGARTLPDPLRLSATSYSGRPIEGSVILPLRPTGRNEPFTFELASREGALVLAADPLNRISVTRPAQ
jgi:general secretion pathway protein H